jgi:hypothetical protein
MPDPVTSGQLSSYLRMVDPLVSLAEELARLTRKTTAPKPQRRGSTLRPGLRTPLWNALIAQVRPMLGRYGEKSKLARILGVPPQRVHAYFGARSQTPDAERTLLLLVWLAGRRTG